MPFLYVSEIGESRFITSKSLKKKLITFTGEEYDDANVNSTVSDDEDISAFLLKLGVDTPRTLNYNEVQDLIEVRFKEYMEEVPVLLTMERIHFMSIIYLLKENLASTDEIVKMLNMPFYSRTEYLLKYLSREDDTMISFNIIFDKFYDIIASLDSTDGKSNGYERENMDIYNMVLPYAAININDTELSMFMNTVASSLQIGNTYKYNSLKFETACGAYNDMDLKINNRSYSLTHISGYEAPSMLSIMKIAASFDLPTDTFYTNEFVNAYFQTLMPVYIRDSFTNRYQHKSKQTTNLTNGWSTKGTASTRLTNSLSQKNDNIFEYALGLDSGSYDFIYYGEYLKNAYVSSGNYFTDVNSAHQAIGTLDRFSAGELAAPYDFDFISNAATKSLLKTIFPTILDYSTSSGSDYITACSGTNITLTDTSYFRKYFFKENNFNGENTDSYYNTSKANTKIGSEQKSIPTILKNIDMIVLNNSITIGSTDLYKLKYISDTKYTAKFKVILKRALDIANIVSLDLDAVDLTWDTIETTNISDYLTSIITLVDSAEGIRFEIAKEDPEVAISLNMYADMFINYLNYLLDSDTYPLNNIPYVKDDSYSNYRIINFVQQTFASIKIFHNQLRKSRYYDLYLLLFGLYYEDNLSTGDEDIGPLYFYNYSLDNHKAYQQVNDLIS